MVRFKTTGLDLDFTFLSSGGFTVSTSYSSFCWGAPSLPDTVIFGKNQGIRVRWRYPQLFSGFLAADGGFRFSWFPVSSLDPRFFWTVRLHAKALIGLLQIRAFFESGPISQIAPQHFECALLWTVVSLCHSSTDPCDFITRCGWHGHPYIASAGYLYGPYGFKLCPSNPLCNWLMCSNHTFTTVSQFWIHTPLGFFWNSSVSWPPWFPVDSRWQEVASEQADPKQKRVWSLITTAPAEECHARTLPLLPGPHWGGGMT